LKAQLPSKSSFALFTAACALAFAHLSAQQSNGIAPASGGKNPSTPVEEFNVKQEFGPQQASRRGDRIGVAALPGQSNGSKGEPGAGTSPASGRQSDAVPRQKHNQQESVNQSDGGRFDPIRAGGTQESAGSGESQQPGATLNSQSPR